MKNIIFIIFLFPLFAYTQDTILYKCSSDMLVLGDVSYTDEGIYDQTFIDVNGLDSVVIFEVVNLEEYYFFFSHELCEGDEFEGTNYFSDTTFIDSLITIQGCDSIIEQFIDVRTFFVSEIAGENHICEGDTSELSVGNYPIYKWSTGEVSPSIQVSLPGAYSVTISDNIGCETELNTLVSQSNLELDISIKDVECKNASNGEIYLNNISGGIPEYSLALSDGMSNILINGPSSFIDLEADEYLLVVEDGAGCRDSINIEIKEPNEDFQVEIFPLQDEFYTDDAIQFFLSANLDFQDVTWDCNTCMFSPSDNILSIENAYSGSIVAEVTNVFGCKRSADFELMPKERIGIIAPNIFSPGNDGINDYFIIKADQDIQLVTLFQIFDRYGNLIHSQKDVAPEEVQWDGRFNGSFVSDGVYTYIIQFASQENLTQNLISTITKI